MGRIRGVGRFLVAFAIAACAGSPTTREPAPTWDLHDALFEAAVRHVASHPQVRVDPAPVRTRTTPVPYQAYEAPDSAVVQRRKAVLRELGVAGSALRVTPCVPVAMARFRPDLADTSGCPAESISVVAFDLPRLRGTDGLWVIPLIRLSYSPRGAGGGNMQNLLFEEVDGAWAVVDVETWGYLD
jgi:hypothetical protein